MQLKKILYVVLVAIMMFSLAAFGIAAEGETNNEGDVTETVSTELSVTVSAKDNVVKPNEKFTVDVKIDNNPGVAAIQFTVVYNNGDNLLYKGFTVGNVFNSKTARIDVTTNDADKTITVVIVNEQFANSAIDGNIISFDFQSNADADLKEIIIDTEEVFSCFNADFDTVNCNIKNSGTIKSHDYKIENFDATCTSNAKTVYTCNKCDSKFENEIADSMLEHKATPGEGKDATCTETGLTNGSFCSVCNAVLEEQVEIPVIEHNYVAGEAKAPTCTEAGNTAGTFCSECGLEGEAQEPVPALGHSFPDEWTVVTNATYKAEGEEKRECLNGCGETETRAIAKLDPPAVNMTSAPTEPWVKGTETGLQFVSSADRSEFKSVSIDGAVIDSSNYVLNTDSTTVVLKASFLETLEDGTHKITITSEYGSASADFTVESASNTAVIVIIIVVAVVVVGVVAVVVILKKKELI